VGPITKKYSGSLDPAENMQYTVEPEKQPFLGNGYVTYNNGITVVTGVFCAVCAEVI
jgi:hypothetical protein